MPYEVTPLLSLVPLLDLAPYVAMAMLATVFPMLYFLCCDNFNNWQLELLNAFTFFTPSPSPFHLVTINLFSVSVSWFLFCFLV